MAVAPSRMAAIDLRGGAARLHPDLETLTTKRLSAYNHGLFAFRPARGAERKTMASRSGKPGRQKSGLGGRSDMGVAWATLI
jgi:hypothetical protein